MAPSITLAESPTAPLRQPWKSCWPPQGEEKKSFTGLGFSKDQRIIMDGTSVFPSTATADNEKAPVQAVAQ